MKKSSCFTKGGVDSLFPGCQKIGFQVAKQIMMMMSLVSQAPTIGDL